MAKKEKLLYEDVDKKDTLGARIQLERHRMGLSRPQLYDAAQCGKTEDPTSKSTTIKNYEYGDTIPDADVLGRICDVLNCDADYLLGRKEERSRDVDTICDLTGLNEEAATILYDWTNQYSKMEERIKNKDNPRHDAEPAMHIDLSFPGRVSRIIQNTKLLNLLFDYEVSTDYIDYVEMAPDFAIDEDSLVNNNGFTKNLNYNGAPYLEFYDAHSRGTLLMKQDYIFIQNEMRSLRDIKVNGYTVTPELIKQTILKQIGDTLDKMRDDWYGNHSEMLDKYYAENHPAN